MYLFCSVSRFSFLFLYGFSRFFLFSAVNNALPILFVYSFLSTIRARTHHLIPVALFSAFHFYYHKFWQTSRVCVTLADVEERKSTAFIALLDLQFHLLLSVRLYLGNG
ncbi:hypothetical protein DFP73DRAFT_548378 [Morchella snyderi]|nr:hypothetical protein DFP73DRAFT_548378 [Morchella snyderi]